MLVMLLKYVSCRKNFSFKQTTYVQDFYIRKHEK